MLLVLPVLVETDLMSECFVAELASKRPGNYYESDILQDKLVKINIVQDSSWALGSELACFHCDFSSREPLQIKTFRV